MVYQKQFTSIERLGLYIEHIFIFIIVQVLYRSLYYMFHAGTRLWDNISSLWHGMKVDTEQQNNIKTEPERKRVGLVCTAS